MGGNPQCNHKGWAATHQVWATGSMCICEHRFAKIRRQRAWHIFPSPYNIQSSLSSFTQHLLSYIASQLTIPYTNFLRLALFELRWHAVVSAIVIDNLRSLIMDAMAMCVALVDSVWFVPSFYQLTYNLLNNLI